MCYNIASVLYVFGFLAERHVGPYPPTRDRNPALEVQNLNHWTTREVPSVLSDLR